MLVLYPIPFKVWGMNKSRSEELRRIEREFLLKRLFWSDRDFFKVGNAAKLSWFEQYRKKFAKDEYAYFSDNERFEAIIQIVSIPDDSIFVKSLNAVFKELDWDRTIKIFLGRYYKFSKKVGVLPDNCEKEVRSKVRGALEDTKERALYFLKAIIELYKEDRWDRAYGGATWQDVLSKIRELKGPYPSPRDLVIVKSYDLYFKTGSRRFPTHTIPPEMIGVIEDELEKKR